MLFFGKYRVLEKRAGTLAIRISGDDQHSLQRADVAHGLPGFGEIRHAFPAFEVALEVGVGDARATSGRKRVSDPENDKASAFASCEDTGTVAEAAGFGAEFAHLV